MSLKIFAELLYLSAESIYIVFRILESAPEISVHAERHLLIYLLFFTKVDAVVLSLTGNQSEITFVFVSWTQRFITLLLILSASRL